MAILPFSRLGLGGHTFLRRFGGADRPNETALIHIVIHAMESGINFFDATYDEERVLLGNCLICSRRRPEAVVSCWAEAKHTPTGEATERECERALRQMKLETLDHFYIEVDCSDDHAAALQRLKQAGKIRCAGILGTQRALAAGREKIDVAVGVHNFYRPCADFTALHQLGIGTIAVEPFGRGRFMQESPHNAAAIAGALLRFALANPAIDSVLATMTTEAQIDANAAVARSADPFSADDEALLKSGRGYEIPFDPWK